MGATGLPPPSRVACTRPCVGDAGPQSLTSLRLCQGRSEAASRCRPAPQRGGGVGVEVALLPGTSGRIGMTARTVGLRSVRLGRRAGSGVRTTRVVLLTGL